VFKLAPNGTETILHAFNDRARTGVDPYAALTIDAAGNLYGTTYEGGKRDLGVVFEVTASGAFQLLHSFRGWNGAEPFADVYVGQGGAVFGTTRYGGTYSVGTVFELAPY
jgi:uncharacterized repeat protein (TIGR03803 family)